LLACESGAAQIHIPALVIAEMMMVAQHGRLPGVTLPLLLTQLNSLYFVSNYVLLPLLPETVIASHALVVIPDIFDRLVVAEARRLDLPLITRDAAIAASGLVKAVWD
jgi:PIN domain nuclease of toxin-antitoxin system